MKEFYLKGTLVSALVLIGFCSCNQVLVKQIGKINMISTRNVEFEHDYVLISSYAGGAQKELKKSTALSIEEAIDQTVRKVAGGEFLVNVKIYSIDKKFFAVEGDVWGKKAEPKEVTYRGFKVGDTVSWKKGGKYYTGKITSLQNDKNCLIMVDGKKPEIKSLLYEEITKIEK